MARNRKVFEQAMRQATNFAWDQKWEKAIAEYRKALKEFPEDISALSGLAQAFLESGQPEEALENYRRVAELTHGDPAALGRVADILESLGRLEEAADACMEMAEAYLREKEIDKAVGTWTRATKFVPGHLEAHQKLADFYIRSGKTNQTIKEYLALARIYQRQGEEEKAIQYCQMALKLDTHHPEAKAMLEALRYGEAAQPTTIITLERVSEEETDLLNATKRKALSDLAMYLFEEIPHERAEAATDSGEFRLSRTQINAILSQAIDLHSRGHVDEALPKYLRVLEAGVNRPALHFNLGMIYQEKLRLEEAIAHFSQATRHPDYALASHFALGDSYRALDRLEDALEHFVEVLKIVDMQTVGEEKADELAQLYSGLAESYKTKGDVGSTLAFANALIEFFGHSGWESRVAEMRKRLNELAGEGVTMALAQVLEAPGFDQILESLVETQKYMDSNLLRTAAEECFWAMEKAPTYLPLHLRLAEILLRQGLTEEATAKYMTVAEVYQVWGENRQASNIYKRILDLAPADVKVRSKIIDLLISERKIDEALENYMALADIYYHLARLNKTLEKYNEALRLSSQSSRPREWQVEILHKIGDIHIQRVDWNQALAAYQRIKSLSPGDEKARLQLVDLYFKQGKSEQAAQELDSLTAYYKEQGQSDKVLSILQEAVEMRPYEMALRARLSQTYLERGLKQKAIDELDALGEMQLEAGMNKEAIETIKLIISLGPKNIKAYKQLLAQLLG